YYVNVHTAKFPGGAVRAQLATFAVRMSGNVEVPKGAPSGSGTAAVSISGTSVCWSFIGLTGIDPPTAAHIHKAAAGKSGPVVVPFGGAFKPSGCTTTTAAIAKSIVAAPGSFYVNVHTAKFPAGAVRAQLRARARVDVAARRRPPYSCDCGRQRTVTKRRRSAESGYEPAELPGFGQAQAGRPCKRRRPVLIAAGQALAGRTTRSGEPTSPSSFVNGVTTTMATMPGLHPPAGRRPGGGRASDSASVRIGPFPIRGC